MDGEGDLVEGGLRSAQALGVVVGAAAALEPLDRLPLTGGLGQRLTAAGDVGVTAAEVGHGLAPALFGALHPRLGGEEVGAGGAGRQDGVAARVAGVGDGVRGVAQQRLTADAVRQLAGEPLPGGILGALAKRADPLEAEGEGRVLHLPVIARSARDLRADSFKPAPGPMREDAGMEQRISVITLGVADLRRAMDFYAAMDWQGRSPDGDVAFFQAGGMVLGLWNRAKLAEDSGVETDGGGWGGMTLAHNVRSPAEVDAVLEHAAAAGATVVRSGAETSWGGYSGVFHDPDGHAWEIAHNPGLTPADDGSVRL